MADGQQVAATEAQIAVHWKEESYRYPPPKFIGQANLSDLEVMKRFSEKNFPEHFSTLANPGVVTLIREQVQGKKAA